MVVLADDASAARTLSAMIRGTRWLEQLTTITFSESDGRGAICMQVQQISFRGRFVGLFWGLIMPVNVIQS